MKLSPELREAGGQSFYSIGVYSGSVMYRPRVVDTPSKSFAQSLTLAFSKTTEGITKTAHVFIILVSGQMSFKNLGGPLSIG